MKLVPGSRRGSSSCNAAATGIVLELMPKCGYIPDCQGQPNWREAAAAGLSTGGPVTGFVTEFMEPPTGLNA